MLLISQLSESKCELTISDFEAEIARVLEIDDLTSAIKDLNVLELCLVIAMKHHIEIYDDAFNFEMILTRYTKFANSSSNIQPVPRPVVLKAFEHLQVNQKP